MRIIGEEGRRRVLDPSSGHLTAGRSNTRAAAIARGRFAEDAMLAAVRDGVTQLIILGAGLDTFAYRAGLPKEVTVFELDHPATQSWKKEMLSSAGIEIPPNVKFLGFDLAAFTLFHALQSGGVLLDQRSILCLLGVTYYVPKIAIEATLRSVASLASGSEIVFDYLINPSLLERESRLEVLRGSQSVAALGEPWVTFFDPLYLGQDLRRFGFDPVEQFDSQALASRYGLTHQYRANRVVHAKVREKLR